MVLTFEQYTTPIVYHGSPEEHDFTKNGYLGRYTFFSTNKNEASGYGDYLYKISLNADLNLFDTNNIEHVDILMSEYGELYDAYYNEDEDEYVISDSETFTNLQDNWWVIEYNNVLDYMSNYDGVWIYEGGIRNLLLFTPILPKLSNIELIKSL